MVSASHEARPTAPPARGTRWHVPPVVAIAASIDLAFYAITAWIVHQYYRTHLPHFDSMGGYTASFEIANLVRHLDVPGVLQAIKLSSISWVYPFNAILWSWSPTRAPEQIIFVNFLFLFVAQLAMLRFGSLHGWSTQRQALLLLLPLVPGQFYIWGGGFQDIRRDAQLNLLLIGVVFASLAYVTRPTRWSGIALGLILGLAQWSRDNALASIILLLAPAVVLAFPRLRAGGLRELGRLMLAPLLTFLALAVPYYTFTLELTLFRYLNTVWGPGQDRLASIRQFWSAPYYVLTGGLPQYGGPPALGTASLLVLGGLVLLLVLAIAAGLLRPRLPHAAGRPFWLLAGSGAYVILAVVLYTTLVLGYGAQFNAIPFMTVGVGIVVLLAGLAELFVGTERAARQPAWAAGAIGLAVVLALGGGAYRMQEARVTPESPDEVQALRTLSNTLAELAGGRPLAVLWVDGFSRHHLNFYVAQAGRPTTINPELPAYFAGEPFDLERVLRPDENPAEIQNLARVSLKKYADFVIVCEDLAQYEGGRVRVWPYTHGRPVVEDLLRDPTFVPVYRFTVYDLPFVVLENRSR